MNIIDGNVDGMMTREEFRKSRTHMLPEFVADCDVTRALLGELAGNFDPTDEFFAVVDAAYDDYREQYIELNNERELST